MQTHKTEVTGVTNSCVEGFGLSQYWLHFYSVLSRTLRLQGYQYAGLSAYALSGSFVNIITVIAGNTS